MLTLSTALLAPLQVTLTVGQCYPHSPLLRDRGSSPNASKRLLSGLQVIKLMILLLAQCDTLDIYQRDKNFFYNSLLEHLFDII